MTILIGMPGGAEWLLIILVIIFLLAMPVMVIVYYSNNKQLKKQVKTLTDEKNALLTRLLDSK